MICVRPARERDADILLDWVNCPDALRNKLKTREPIDRADHVQWLSTRLEDEGTVLLIVEDDGVPIGQVRFQLAEEAFEIDVFVAASKRGRGYAQRALRLAVEAFNCEHREREKLRARIRHGNFASVKLFEALGFSVVTREPEHDVYELTTDPTEFPKSD